jgi:hypothetical protein
MPQLPKMPAQDPIAMLQEMNSKLDQLLALAGQDTGSNTTTPPQQP